MKRAFSRDLALRVAVCFGGAMAIACQRETSGVNPETSAPFERELPPDEADIPCAPRLVLQTVCQRCHTRPLRNGAPFPLINRSDIVTNTYGGTVVRELMVAELTAGRMPPPPVTISEADKGTLLDWLRAEAPAEPNANCDSDAADAAR